jgi:nicotinate-nucleotide pyrophosphorylase (carboxylating)
MPPTIQPSVLSRFIKAALSEDVGSGDHTSLACIPADSVSRAKLLVKADGVLAGVDLAKRIFRQVDKQSKVEVFKKDGHAVRFGDIAFEVTCNTRALLIAERLVLNTMQRMSGIATMSRRFADAVAGLPVRILDTRKTTPGIRFLEKWAVRIGGCTNYREGLYDRFMIKDNHVDACGGIRQAIERVLAYRTAQGLDLGLTVEVRHLADLRLTMEAAPTGTRIMLDNFDLATIREAVALVGDRFELEVSGGVTLETVRAIAETGVDFISVGALTHSAGCLDLSLKVLK